MAKIRIVAVPPGQAPKWVREQWVGLELPVAENTPSPEDSQVGVNYGKPREFIETILEGPTEETENEFWQRVTSKYKPENIGGYPVETRIAIEILRKKSPAAAQWWEENISPSIIPWLVFKKEVCELV